MNHRHKKLLIINRSFWPIYPVIGEALMRFAEREAKHHEVGVVLQDHAGIRQQLERQQRGKGVNFYPCKAWTTSGSTIIRRIADAIFFMVWVLIILLWKRPNKIYVSTDPPVLVPFIVMLYSRLFNADYIYHLQDIHPEATNVVMPMNSLVFRFFRWLDVASMRRARLLITLTAKMAQEIQQRSGIEKNSIVILQNPSVAFDGIPAVGEKKNGFVFCGNAGRLQRIPLIIDAIEDYIEQGGSLVFVFAGAGVYAEKLQQLSLKYPANVVYHGFVSADKAAQLNCEYEWALLPIEDDVTRYAFPSKSSSYVFADALIVAVCSRSTSVADWVVTNDLGVVVEPQAQELCQFFFDVENGNINRNQFSLDRSILKQQLGFELFVDRLSSLVFNGNPNVCAPEYL